MSREVRPGGESKTRDPQAGHTDGGRRPGRARSDPPQGWGRRAATVAPETESHLAQRPGREKRKTRGHSCTSHTEQHQALRSLNRCAHTQGGNTQDSTTRNSRVRGAAVSFFQVARQKVGFFPFVPRRPPALRCQWPVTFRFFLSQATWSRCSCTTRFHVWFYESVVYEIDRSASHLAISTSSLWAT